VAAATTLPVIGVPIDVSLDGLDALLATVQMPGGIPVATVAIGKAGAKNAAILALQILATTDLELASALASDREAMGAKVRAANEQLQQR
jgi:5-(carboxyamino)imidazole ribonucleotide mutase